MEGWTVIKNRIYVDRKMAESMAFSLMLDIQSFSRRDILENLENETIYYLASTGVLLTVDIPGGLWDYPAGRIKAIDYHDLISKSATEEIKSLLTPYRGSHYSRSDKSEKIGDILRQVYPGNNPVEIANLYLKQKGVHVADSVLSVYNGGTFGLFK
jgi:hypothetical protein